MMIGKMLEGLSPINNKEQQLDGIADPQGMAFITTKIGVNKTKNAMVPMFL